MFRKKEERNFEKELMENILEFYREVENEKYPEYWGLLKDRVNTKTIRKEPRFYTNKSSLIADELLEYDYIVDRPVRMPKKDKLSYIQDFKHLYNIVASEKTLNPEILEYLDAKEIYEKENGVEEFLNEILKHRMLKVGEMPYIKLGERYVKVGEQNWANEKHIYIKPEPIAIYIITKDVDELEPLLKKIVYGKAVYNIAYKCKK